MTRYSLPLILSVIALSFLSCDREINKVESQLYVAKALQAVDGEYLYVDVQQKDVWNSPRRLLGVARDTDIDLRFLDDSTLMMSNIRSRLDGYPILVANLKVDSIPYLDWPGGVHVIGGDTITLAHAEQDGWNVTTSQLQSTPNVLIITIESFPPGRHLWRDAVVFLGADDIKIDSLNSCVAFVSCRWIGSKAMQHFKFDVTDDRWPPVISLTE